MTNMINSDGDQELEEWYKEMLRLENRLSAAEPRSKLFQRAIATQAEVQEYIALCKSILTDKCEYSREDIKTLVQEAEAIDIRDKAIAIVFELLFDDPAKFTNIVTKHKSLLFVLVNERPDSQRNLLRTLDLYMREEPKLLPQTAKLLQFLYNEDLVEEEVFLEYFPERKRTRNEYRSRAVRFVDWLKSAEEDSKEDDKDDDDYYFAGEDSLSAEGEARKKSPESKSRRSSFPEAEVIFDSAGGDTHHSIRRGIQPKPAKSDRDSIDEI